MSRLPPLRPSKVAAALKHAGFVQLRQRGSHAVLAHPDGRTVVLPIHNRDMKRGTLIAIIKQAGFSQDQFLELL